MQEIPNNTTIRSLEEKPVFSNQGLILIAIGSFIGAPLSFYFGLHLLFDGHGLSLIRALGFIVLDIIGPILLAIIFVVSVVTLLGRAFFKNYHYGVVGKIISGIFIVIIVYFISHNIAMHRSVNIFQNIKEGVKEEMDHASASRIPTPEDKEQENIKTYNEYVSRFQEPLKVLEYDASKKGYQLEGGTFVTPLNVTGAKLSSKTHADLINQYVTLKWPEHYYEAFSNYVAGKHMPQNAYIYFEGKLVE